MSEHKNKPSFPRVEVVRRESPSTSSLPRVSPPAMASPRREVSLTSNGRSRPRSSSSSPSLESIQALARKERVPLRIARGELEGKMRCRIWRKLHAEEARRFDDAYRLVAQHPEVSLPDAFGVMQAGIPVAEFLARKKRTRKRDDVKQGRLACSNEGIESLWQQWRVSRQELAVVMADKTFRDSILSIEPMDFEFQRSGIFSKLQVVVVTAKETWERHVAHLPRDSKLAKKPAAVARLPERRPVFDPRVFLPHLNTNISVVLRNGILLTAPLLSVGSFDLILGTPGAEWWVPLHAMVEWKPSAS